MAVIGYKTIDGSIRYTGWRKADYPDMTYNL